MNNKYKALFSPIQIGNMKIKNRIVRSATFELKAKDGQIEDDYLQFYKSLSEGGVGLIITGYGTVHSDNVGDATPCLANNNCMEGISKLAKIIHEYGSGCKIAFQLCHVGRQFRAHNDRLLAPSAVKEPVFNNMPNEMTHNDIKVCVDQFVNAITKIKKCGIDGIQLHAAHGWLLSTFLSPATNHRTDEYGGSTEKRVRIMIEIITKARELVGLNFPIMAKINASDYIDNGIDIYEAKKIATILANVGYDALEISSCMWATTKMSEAIIGWKAEMIPEARTNIMSEENEGYHQVFAEEIKKVVGDIPIMVVGGFRTPRLMDNAIVNGGVDMISMCRPFIREPNLPNRWMEGDDGKSKCISCNKCLDTLYSRNLHCPLRNY